MVQDVATGRTETGPGVSERLHNQLQEAEWKNIFEKQAGKVDRQQCAANNGGKTCNGSMSLSEDRRKNAEPDD